MLVVCVDVRWTGLRLDLLWLLCAIRCQNLGLLNGSHYLRQFVLWLNLLISSRLRALHFLKKLIFYFSFNCQQRQSLLVWAFKASRAAFILSNCTWLVAQGGILELLHVLRLIIVYGLDRGGKDGEIFEIRLHLGFLLLWILI